SPRWASSCSAWRRSGGPESCSMSGDHPPAGSGAAPPPSPGRREFLTRVSVALGALGAAIVAIPVVGFLLAPFLEKQSQVWRPVGTVDSFRPGMTVKVDFPEAAPPASRAGSRRAGRDPDESNPHHDLRAGAMGVVRRVWRAFDDRAGITQSLGPVLRHPVPKDARWYYVFGSATLFAFLLQVV